MKKAMVSNCPVYATIKQGNTHIERRVYEDDNGTQMVKINGCFFSIEDIKNLGDQVDIYF